MNRLFVRELVSVGAVDDGDDPQAHIQLWKRQFTSEQRDRLAAKGQALPDGSYPIVTVADLRNAIAAAGRASNPGQARAHVVKRAKALGRLDLLPDAWEVSKIKHINPDRDRTKEPDMDVPDLSALEDEQRAAIEKAFADYESRITELETNEPVDVMKDLPDEALARFEELEKRAAEQADELAKERDARLTVEWVGKARAFEKILGDSEAAAPHLKTLPDETASWLLEKLAAAEKVLEKSDLFKELGADDAGTAADQVEALAVEKRSENPDLTMAQAKTLVRKENPDLKARERAEVK